MGAVGLSLKLLIFGFITSEIIFYYLYKKHSIVYDFKFRIMLLISSMSFSYITLKISHLLNYNLYINFLIKLFVLFTILLLFIIFYKSES